jgi:Tfp pilus assembly protein PilF
MIARDEQRFLEQCLQSIKNVVDEILLVDTGSVDETVEIARGQGARVLNFEWVEDFSKARNHCIRNARSEWILVLDADEVISERDHVRLRALTTQDEYDGFTLLQRNYTNSITDLWKCSSSGCPETLGFSGYDEVPIIRLFKNRKDIRFSGIIHEVVGYSDGSILKQKATDIPIHHYGKLRSPAEMKSKSESYLNMNLRKAELEPFNPKAFLELGRQWFECGMYAEAVEAFEKSLALDPNPSLTRFDLAVACWKTGALARAETILKELSVQNPSANTLAMLGTVYMETDETEKALTAFQEALKKDPEFVPAYNNIGIIHSRRDEHGKSIPFFQAALTIDPGFTRARGNLALAYERTSDLGSAIRTYRELLAAEPKSAPFVHSRLKAMEECL